MEIVIKIRTRERMLQLALSILYKIYGIMKKIYLLAISVCVSLNISANSYSAEEKIGDEVQTQRIVTKEEDVHIKYPKYYQTTGLEVEEVIINSKYTILHLKWNNVESGQTWLNVSPDAYISVYNDTPKGKKYKLLDAQLIKIAPEADDVPKKFYTEFFLYFEPISKTSYQIIFIDPREVGGLPSIWGIWLY